MFSFLINIVKYIFNYKDSLIDDDVHDEDWLAEQILNLEIENEKYESDFIEAVPDVPTSGCFERTGIVTYIGENYILIDGMLYLELNDSFSSIKLNDTIRYIGYKNDNDMIKVVRIVQNLGPMWDETIENEIHYDVIEHVIVCEVISRDKRIVSFKDTDLKLDLDQVQSNFIPVTGDWVELVCNMQWSDDIPTDIPADRVIKILSIKPLRTIIKTSTVTSWSNEFGVCDKYIYFDKQSFTDGFIPQIGCKVLVEAVESNQGLYSWRAIRVILDDNVNEIKNITIKKNELESTFELEKEKKISFTQSIIFENVRLHDHVSVSVNLANLSTNEYKILKWKILGRRLDSQLHIKPVLTYYTLLPNANINFVFTCTPKFLGHSKELFVLDFKGFQLKRWIEINVIDNEVILEPNVTSENNYNNRNHIINSTKNTRNILNSKNKNCILGVRPLKPPAFVSVKLGIYPIPKKVWSVVLGDSDQTIYSLDFERIVNRIETSLPCLSSVLNMYNYTDKWHTLLYMEEIQQNLQMRSFDMPKTFLDKHREYLSVKIEGLAERRPSLITGDRVIAKDIWDPNKPDFEGYIHDIQGNTVLIKFHPHFHEEYSGYDISLEFHFSRMSYRKCHQAINLAITNLGSDILFPNRILCRSPQIQLEGLESINWYNKKINNHQKIAIYNILLGVCRPLPYCIYGPPGTGKTITVVELILQILTLLPDSRILVATPSNSAANLITERLVYYKNECSSSIIRLIANHLLDSETISDIIKPYCATIDLARENTTKSKQRVTVDGINKDCQSSFIGRHRVTIGTCVSLGSLALLGLPHGHFTHVIVDEAGQATEPEIMIPLTFIHQDKGQIILSGDPMQLGPIIKSKYCIEFGMQESYFSRILETFPYQRDVQSYESEGYDCRFVTKLLDNYRSISQVLSLPSAFFYNNSLVSRINIDESWINKLLTDVSHMFPTCKENSGLYMCGIRGCNYRANDSPSWYNPQEALMVLMSVCKLYKQNVSNNDIGIISPYLAQIKYLRLLFESTGAIQPKIGTVEEFQGQERPIIFITTVRSIDSKVEEDIRHSLGFIKNPKRVNVALTRGQVAVIIFCNPHLLCMDQLWQKIIAHTVKNECYTGCDLPYNMLDIESK